MHLASFRPLKTLTLFIGLAMLYIGAMAGTASAEVNINVNLDGPPVLAVDPINMISVPNLGVHFVPDPGVDAFYYENAWWSHRGKYWYTTQAYTGAWIRVKKSFVPRAVLGMPANYRVLYANTPFTPYGQWHKAHYGHYKKGHNKKGHNKKHH